MTEPTVLPVVRVEPPRRTDKELAITRAEVVLRFGVKEFTCDDCPERWSCLLAFDPYNTDGDCLAEK